MYRNRLKRLIDLTVATVALVILLPLFIVITVILYFANSGKPFFTQKRPGKNCSIFKIIKFKTMNDKRDRSGELLPDSERLTRFGSLVRTLSLDELPQLINVLKGEMSLIGPRPLLPEYINLYSQEQMRRHEVRPGITGWAQVNGRNAISWSDKFQYDVWYVNNVSFSLDIKIVFLTIKKVVIREGINSDNSVTMERFRGN